MTYFEAERMRQGFIEYKRLAEAYWAAVRPLSRSWMGNPDAPVLEDTPESRLIRPQIARREAIVERWAQELGIAVTGMVHPGAAVGGPVLPFNLLSLVIDPRVGFSVAERDRIRDAIERCIGAATDERDRLWRRLTRPWYWFVDIPALVVGWPFEVMKKAGVPPSFIDGTIPAVIKTILAWLLTLGGGIGAIFGFAG